MQSAALLIGLLIGLSLNRMNREKMDNDKRDNGFVLSDQFFFTNSHVDICYLVTVWCREGIYFGMLLLCAALRSQSLNDMRHINSI